MRSGLAAYAQPELAQVLPTLPDRCGDLGLVLAGVHGFEGECLFPFLGASACGGGLLEAAHDGGFGHVDQVATGVGMESSPDLHLYGLTHARVTANIVGSSKPRELAATSTLTSADDLPGAIPSCPKEVTHLLNRDLHDLADRLADGEVTAEDAAAELRSMARFTPAENCTRMVSTDRYLARVDDAWSWSITTGKGYHGATAQLISNKFTRHPSNVATVIDFRWWEPADIDTFGRAICSVAGIVQAQNEADADGDG